MIFSPNNKRHLRIAGSILLALLLLLFSANVFLGSFIEKKLSTILMKDDTKLYHLSIGKVRTNILSGKIRLSEIQLSPDSTMLVNTRKGNAVNPLLFEVNMKELRVTRFKLINTLVNKQINIGKIVLTQPHITILKGEKTQPTQVDGLHMDSIPIKGISGIDLGNIALNQANFTFIDLLSSDTIFSTSASKIELKGLDLNKLADSSDLFQLNHENLSFEINDEQMHLPGGNYRLDLKQLEFNVKDKEIQMAGLSISPRDADVYRLARKLYYTSEIYTVTIGSIQLKSIDLIESINTKSVFIDSVKVSELDLSILMDKRLPFNTERRPALPNQLLKTMDFPLYIGVLQVENSNLLYQEKMSDIKAPMSVTLNNLNIDAKRTTSIKDSLRIPKDMTIRLKADFMNKARLHINFAFPLYFKTDTFFYTGALGPAVFSIFNKATLSAINAKFTEGQLQSINFKGSANNLINTGELTMLYNNLKAEISRKDFKTKNKIMSLAANTAMLKSNPGNNGKIRIAHMSAERVAYKGFGNFMWKTLQNGIITTILPTGEKEKIDSNKTKR